MSFGSNPGDPLPYAEATGNAPSDGGSDAESAPAPAVSAPGAVAPCVQCTITSETIMTQPADRARLNIGVGERVRLTFSLGNANWTITQATAGCPVRRGQPSCSRRQEWRSP